MLTIEQKDRIKVLAIKADITAEENTELEGLMVAAGTDQLQKAALKAIEDLPTAEDIDAKIEAGIKGALDKLAAEPPVNRGAPAIKKITKPGFSNEENDAFAHFIKTGDIEAVRAVKASNVNPLESHTDAQGKVTVPEDWYNQIVAKRGELSIPRLAGARIINTKRQVIHVPTESTATDVFVQRSDDEAAVDEDEPIFTTVPLTIYDFTKLIKVSDDLLDDEDANLQSYLTDTVGRSLARTENNKTLVGAGSTTMQGVFVGGTLGKTFASATVIAAAEIPDLLGALKAAWLQGAVFTMKNATYRAITALGTSTFRWFAQTPSGMPNNQQGMVGMIEDVPVIISDECAALGAGNKSIMLGNWNAYALAERKGLEVIRLDELYKGNLQTGFIWVYRQGGAVLQAEAFQYGKHPTS